MEDNHYDGLLSDSTKAKVYMNNNYGIIDVINSLSAAEDHSYSTIFGTDLASYGVDFEFTDSHFPFYINPWTESNIRLDMRFYNAKCYHQARPPKNSHISNFSIDTLFYIFYNIPEDLLHRYAALELYNSNWLFNTHHKLWMTNKHPNNKVSGIMSPQNSSSLYLWTYFDPYQWEFKIFPGNINKQHFLSIEELRSSLYINNDDNIKANGHTLPNFQSEPDVKF